MADTVSSQTIENGPRNFVAKFTNLSDGTGESAVTKVDPTSSGTLGVNVGGQIFYPGIHLTVREIWYDVSAMKVRMLWDATSDTDMFILSGFGKLDFSRLNGLPNPNNAGATGKIQFTTVGAAANSTYSILLWCQKNVPQS